MNDKNLNENADDKIMRKQFREDNWAEVENTPSR